MHTLYKKQNKKENEPKCIPPSHFLLGLHNKSQLTWNRLVRLWNHKGCDYFLSAACQWSTDLWSVLNAAPPESTASFELLIMCMLKKQHASNIFPNIYEAFINLVQQETTFNNVFTPNSLHNISCVWKHPSVRWCFLHRIRHSTYYFYTVIKAMSIRIEV